MLWTKGFLGHFHDFRRFMFRVPGSVISFVRSRFCLVARLRAFHIFRLTKTDFLFVIVCMSKFENGSKLTMDLRTDFCSMLFGLMRKINLVLGRLNRPIFLDRFLGLKNLL
jgi:hypothetical protein